MLPPKRVWDICRGTFGAACVLKGLFSGGSCDLVPGGLESGRQCPRAPRAERQVEVRRGLAALRGGRAWRNPARAGLLMLLTVPTRFLVTYMFM